VNEFDAERFDKLVAQHAPADAAPPNPESGVLDALLVNSFLLFDSTSEDAERAQKKLLASFVDLNEMRVARLDDLLAAIGPRYPKAEERMAALKRTLNDLFEREHTVTLDSVAEKNKRDAKQFLSTLAGCPPFVSARVLLVGFGGHAAPLDSMLLERLTESKVFTEPVDLDRAVAGLERHVKATDALATHYAIERLRDGKPKSSTRAQGAKPVGKRS
jgi:hypothetical protein